MSDNPKRSPKVEQILKKIKRGDKRPSKPYQGPPDMNFLIQNTTEGTGDRVLREFNQSTLDDVGPVTDGDREMRVLREMNELQEFENTPPF